MQLSECLLEPGSELTGELVGNIQHKQELLAVGDTVHRDIKTALVIEGGGMRGVFAGGVVTGLEELGLTEAFDNVIGVSVGASAAAYFLAGQAALGTTLFYEELTSKEFIDRRRLLPFIEGDVLSVDYLQSIFTGEKTLDQAAIQRNRSRFHIGLTDINAAQSEYIEVNPERADDLIELIQGSSAVPGASRLVTVNGVVYGDGSTTCRNPIGYAIEELGATDILCVNNHTLRQHSLVKSLGNRATTALLTRGYSPAMRRAYRDRHMLSDESAETSYSSEVRIGILCPPEDTIRRMTQDPAKLEEAAARATQQTKALFAGGEPLDGID